MTEGSALDFDRGIEIVAKHCKECGYRKTTIARQVAVLQQAAKAFRRLHCRSWAEVNPLALMVYSAWLCMNGSTGRTVQFKVTTLEAAINLWKQEGHIRAQQPG